MSEKKREKHTQKQTCQLAWKPSEFPCEQLNTCFAFETAKKKKEKKQQQKQLWSHRLMQSS